MDGGERRYLVMLRVNPPLAAAIGELMKRIERLAKGSHRMAYSSASGETFGVFLRSTRAAAQIRAALECEYTPGDKAYIIVAELGDGWAGIGGARAWEWLQHH